jgi:hypothetical protein
MVYWTDPSKLPALLSDEGFEIGRRDPDGVQFFQTGMVVQTCVPSCDCPPGSDACGPQI